MRVAFSAPTLDGLADEMSGATTVSKIELNDATLKSWSVPNFNNDNGIQFQLRFCRSSYYVIP